MIEEELTYMYGLQRFGVKPGLEVMQRLMKALGNPEKSLRSVHIAGTNGKGSTAAFVSSVLEAEGYNVGLYTSPHLVKFNERIQIDGVAISDEVLAHLVSRIRSAAQHEHIEVTFFEFTTALAFLYFAEQRVDIAVIEVGMGGRLDATNVLKPLVSVITTIGWDHMEHLGDTLIKIAGEKAGIMKSGVPVVIGEKKSDIRDFLVKTANETHAHPFVVFESLHVRDIDASLDRQTFTVEGVFSGTFTIHLLGKHQVDNALTALGAITVLREKGVQISDSALREGLEKARWDGRMQVISQSPLIIVDGAHNEDGMEMLYEFIKDFSEHSVVVVAQKRGKQIPVLTERIIPLFKNVIVTEGTYRPIPAAELAKSFSSVSRIQIIPDVLQATSAALKILPTNGFLLVTGSLYMIGGALEALKSK